MHLVPSFPTWFCKYILRRQTFFFFLFMGKTLFVLLSRTEEILWDNPIPSCIFDYIETHSGLTKKETVKLKRHDSRLIESFRYTYGQILHSCCYAYLMEIPDYCQHVYDVIRVPCYSSSFYPERIFLRDADSIL